MCGNIPGLYPLGASGTPSHVTSKNAFRCCQVPHAEAKLPPAGSNGLKYWNGLLMFDITLARFATT